MRKFSETRDLLIFLKLGQNLSGVVILGHSERFLPGPNGSEVGRLWRLYDTQLWSHFTQVKIFRDDPKSLPQSEFVPVFWKMVRPWVSKKFWVTNPPLDLRRGVDLVHSTPFKVVVSWVECDKPKSIPLQLWNGGRVDATITTQLLESTRLCFQGCAVGGYFANIRVFVRTSFEKNCNYG